MAEQAPLASQENVLSNKELSPIGENPWSSPVLPDLPKQLGSKPRKAPTITPRSFTRFFTPKSSLERGGRIGASRQALRDITASASNRKGRRIITKESFPSVSIDIERTTYQSKKRKRTAHPSPETTPDRSSPLKRIRNQSLEIAEDDKSDTKSAESENEIDEALQNNGKRYGTRRRIVDPFVQSGYRGYLGRNLQREIGGNTRYSWASNVRQGFNASKEWQYETTDFVTRPEDAYTCMNVAAPREDTIPFCTASCHTNSLVALGDEDGGIRLLETAKDDKPGFSKAYLIFRPHANAILDITFSPDDLLLATASGDQTSQVIDMPTQRATYTMAGHVSSVKQVCFQPGSSDVLATSSRDGSVQIWDLRCKSFDGPVRDIKISLDPNATGAPVNHKTVWPRSVNTIFEAHAIRQTIPSAPTITNKQAPSFDAPSKTESPGRRGDVSITALSFLSPSRSHLLLTASEANASVKLWDLRTTHNHRRSRATPLSSTRQPESHNKHRHFGLTSLSLSGDNSRVYTLCRDNTIYAYSTSHLILGHAPELSTTSVPKPRRSGGPERESLGPIYGFRHPQFHATTFYVKSAIRPAKDDKTELLAVGSSDGCAVIFPTDERYMHAGPNRPRLSTDSVPFRRPRPALTRTDSGSGLAGRLNDTIPIYQHGSALVRGHSKEVTGLTWTQRGELVTVGDDFTGRCWREERGEARALRMGGESGGRRWMRGWAEAEAAWDEDDD